MSRIRTAAVAIVSTVAIGGLSTVAAPQALAAKPAPCAQQQAQVAKAQAKLDALTAKYAAHHTKKVQKAKKAQAQRVAQATKRLNKCLAAHPAA